MSRWSDGDQGRGRTGKSNQISHGCNGSQPPKNTTGVMAGRIAKGREPQVGIEGGVRIDGQEGPILTVATPALTVVALHTTVRSHQRDQNPKQWYHCWLGPGVSTR